MRFNDEEQAFENQYRIVFDDKGKPRNCGREDCIKLIELANDCDSHYRFGNLETGMLEVGNLHHLHYMILGIA